MGNAVRQTERLLLAALFGAVLAASVLGAEPGGRADVTGVEAAFRDAVEAEPWSPEQRRLLERVAKEGPDSRCADDALWLLGQMAYRAGDHRHAVYYWQYLVALRPDVILEDDTKGLEVYATSGLPQVEFYLEATARQYVLAGGAGVRGGRHFVGARPVNAAAMLAWGRLGECYEEMGRPALALAAYRNARSACPSGGTWRERYDASVRRLEDDLGVAPEPEPELVAPAGAALPQPGVDDDVGEAGRS